MAEPGKQKTGSMENLTIEQILSPRGIDEFLAEFWSRSPLHLAGEEGRFNNILNWRELNRLLEEYPLDSTRLRVFRNGKRLADELYRTCTKGLDAGMLSTLLGHGATLVIDFIDDIWPSIRRVADAVAEAIPARASINLYASWGTESGFKLHADSHDVIVLQLAGNKQWTIHGPTRINPLEGDNFEPPLTGQKPAWSGVLGDGDVLYIPRGWPHIVAPTGQPSLHLTIGLTQPTGSGFLRWLAQELDKEPEVRATIPQSNEAKKAWLDRARILIDQKMSARSVDAFLSNDTSRQLARRHFSLPDFARIPPAEWTGGTTFYLASNRRLDLREVGDGSASVEAAGQKFSCPATIGPALRTLSNGHPVRLDSLETGLGSQATQDLKRTLAIMVQLGLLFSERAEQGSS